jgi:hypothetical protein
LQDRDHALLNSIDQHALDRVHIFDHACHQIARGAIIEPAQRQQLDVRIQIAAQIENDFLLERVVQDDPQRVEYVLKHKRDRRQCNKRQQSVRAIRAHNAVDDPLRYTREHDHR